MSATPEMSAATEAALAETVAPSSSTAPTQSEIDAARLAHKRALDRKSQNAKRERTRLRILTLEQKLVSAEESLRQLAGDKARLEEENSQLRASLAAVVPAMTNLWGSIATEGGFKAGGSGRLASGVCSLPLAKLFDRGVRAMTDMAMDRIHHGPPSPARTSSLAATRSPATHSPSPPPPPPPAPLTVAPQQTSSIFDVLSPTLSYRGQLQMPQQHLFRVLPCNSSPVCLSDQIMDTFKKAQRPPYECVNQPERPNILSLIAPEGAAAIPPILRVASDVLRTFTDIASLPEQVGGLYLMFRLLNWQVHPSRETYHAIPEWLRPIPLQLRIAHPAWMDAIPWPRVRAHLVSRQDQYDFDSWSAFYSPSLTVSWPYSPSDAIMPISDEEIVASPIFEQHWQNIRNWNVREAFRHRFPEVGAMVDEYTR